MSKWIYTGHDDCGRETFELRKNIMSTQIRGQVPQQITNFKYNIEAAEASGYIVTGPYRREHYEDSTRPGILFAGTLADALDYIRQEIIKHDEWREEGPNLSATTGRQTKPRASSSGRL